MSERKVLNKYYPPDFDPSKLAKIKRAKDKQDNVRMMLPMSVRCNTCGNFLYIGTKFNMRKETCNDEDYLGIKIFRFYFKCSRCYAEVTMKTDPKNHDYVAEHGATRNYEPWRDIQHAENVLKAKRQLEDDDAMKNLENRTYDSKREMDVLDALEEVKQMNKRLAKVNHEELLLKTLAKYDKDKDVEQRENDYIKESYEQHKERLKYKRINDQNGGYEDGDNFDRDIGTVYGRKKGGKAIRNIDNPYEFLEQMANDETGEGSEDDHEDSDSNDEGDANEPIKTGKDLLNQFKLPLKRKQPEDSNGFNKLDKDGFKQPMALSKSTVNGGRIMNKLPIAMKRVNNNNGIGVNKLPVNAIINNKTEATTYNNKPSDNGIDLLSSLVGQYDSSSDEESQ
eukprot:403342728